MKATNNSKYIKNRSIPEFDYLGSCIFILYFCRGLLQTVVAKFSGTALAGDIYAAVFVACILCFALTRGIEYFISTIICYTCIFILFAATIIIHPEYMPWYFERTYGIQKQFFYPFGGIWAFLVVSLMTDEKAFIKTLELSIWLIFFYLCFQFSVFLRLGYWQDYDQNYKLIKVNYNMGFGYSMLFVVVFSLANAVLNKKLLYYIPSICGFFLILLAGSRGPLLCVGISVCLILLSRWQTFSTTTKKVLFLLLILFSPVFIYSLLNYSKLLGLFASFLSRIGIQSRTISAILEGELSNVSGRDKIAELTLQRIAEGGAFGNGVFGERVVVGRIARWGYAHNIFLEIYAAFGYVGGTIAVIVLFYFIILTAIKCRSVEKQIIFITFFGCSTKLLISDSFWFYHIFWSLLAIIVMWRQKEKEEGKEGVRGVYLCRSFR